MLFQHVAIAGLAHIDAPRRLSSDEINLRLKPTLDRLGIKTDVLQDIAGIHARRLWDEGMQASDAATLAGVKALADAGIDPNKVGLLINTSVSRDYLEPSTASIVSGNLRLPDTCQNFDVANACLAFLNGMDIASRMIADGRMLMIEGVKLGHKTFAAAKIALGWAVEELDQFVIHQVSKAHTKAFLKAFRIDPAKVMTIFGEHGNIGPASVPIVLSKLREMGTLKKGNRIALLGIGSGLNCSMAEVVW